MEGVVFVLLAAVTLVALAGIGLRFGPWLFGPLLPFEAVRLARNRWLHRQRVLYVLFLLGFVYAGQADWSGRHQRTLWDSFWAERTLGLAERAAFAESTAAFLFGAQLVGLLLLTPLCVVGGVAADFERRNLEPLLLTDLSDREIVLGKLAARLLSLLGTLLAGAPVLAILPVWGGVSSVALLTHYALAAVVLLVVGSHCVYCAIEFRPPWVALWIAYVAVLCPGIPLALLAARFGGGGDSAGLLLSTATICAVLLGFGVWSGSASIRALRRQTLPSRPTRPPAPAADASTSSGRPTEVVGDQPLWWRERRARGAILAEDQSFSGLRLLLLLATVPLAVGMVLVEAVVNFQTLPPCDGWWALGAVVNPVVRVLGTLLASGVALGTAFLAAGRVSGERERRTLDELRLLPTDRWRILWVKALASFWPFRRAAVALALVWMVGAATGGLHPLALPLLFGAAAAHVALLAGLGIGLSVVCRTTARALVALTVAVLPLVGGLAVVVRAGCGLLGCPVPAGLTAGLTLPRTYWTLAFFWGDLAVPLPAPPGASCAEVVTGTVVGLAMYGLLAVGCWGAAIRRFERSGGAG